MYLENIQTFVHNYLLLLLGIRDSYNTTIPVDVLSFLHTCSYRQYSRKMLQINLVVKQTLMALVSFHLKGFLLLAA